MEFGLKMNRFKQYVHYSTPRHKRHRMLRLALWRCDNVDGCINQVTPRHPLPSSSHHLSYDYCLENKMEYYQNCSALCTTVVHNDSHTYEQFLKMSVGLGLGLLFGQPCVQELIRR